MSDISTDAMMREAAMMDASNNHVWARKVRRLCIERDKLKAEVATLRDRLARMETESEGWKKAFAAQSSKLQKVLHIPGVRAALAPTDAAQAREAALTVAQAAQVLLDAMTARPQVADPFDACDVEVERLAIEYSSQGGDAVMVLETAEKFMLAGLRALIGERP